MTDLPAGHDTQAAFATVFVDEWLRAGVTDAVVAPGSRSTPMLVALAERAEAGDLHLHVVLDERSAGFIALGLGRASGRPALVVTTSGTAAVELHPAVVEADQGGVPLIAVTADRPPELHDCGAPQTIHQVGLFGSAPRWQLSPGVPDLGASRSWRAMASRAAAEALGYGHRPGPVYLNLAFREPLLGSAAAVLRRTAGPAVPPEVVEGRPGREPWHLVPRSPEPAPPTEVVELLAGAGRGLIVAGPGAGDAARDAIATWALAEVSGWPVLAEPTSGCRWPGAIASAGSLLRTDVARTWAPDIVLRLGGPWLSPAVNGWLSSLSCPQVLVDEWGTWAAPDRQPGYVVRASPGALCRALVAALAERPVPPADRDASWWERWSTAERVAQEAIDQVLAAEAELTEPALARELVGCAPDGTTLVVSSSMPVRDVEWWSKPRRGIRVIANRGANGIDGILSTALGVALGGPGPVVALLGDLAFAYDISALAPATRLGAQLDIVVVDNGGGGIFDFLPQAAQQPPSRFERLWTTPHGLDLSGLARSFGAGAAEVGDLPVLVKRLSQPRGDGVKVHVVRTDRRGNVGVHERLHRAVGTAVSGLAKS